MTAEINNLNPKQERRLMCPNCAKTVFNLIKDDKAKCAGCGQEHPLVRWFTNLGSID